MASKFKCPVGLSDHSIGHYPAIISVALGARMIEKHFTTSKKLKGPDHKASVLPSEFGEMIKKVREAEIILGREKKYCQNEEREMSKVSRKSLTLKSNMDKGEILTKKNICLKRPGTGLFFKELKKLIGKKIKKKQKKNYQIKLNDFKIK